MMVLFEGAYSDGVLNSWKQLAWAMHHAIAEEILAKNLSGLDMHFSMD